jgi:hypothetical protein
MIFFVRFDKTINNIVRVSNSDNVVLTIKLINTKCRANLNIYLNKN